MTAEDFIECNYHSIAGLEADKLIDDRTGKEVSFEEIAEAYHEHKLKLLGIADVMAMLPVVELSKVNRVEVIDENGRSYVNFKPTNKTSISIQDDGKTLKVFIGNERQH